MQPRRIGVIGCGIAGSCVAMLLARQGHAITLFEQSPVLGPVGAGILLQPLGQCVLKKIGMLDRVTCNAEPIHELDARVSTGHRLIRMPFSAAKIGQYAFGVHRGDIFEVFRVALTVESIQWELGANIERCEIDSSNRSVTLTSTDQRKWTGFDHIIVTNGARSLLRNQLGFNANVRPYDYSAMWCTGRTTQVRNRLFQMVQGTHRLLGILPVGLGRASFFWGLPEAAVDDLLKIPIERWKDEVIRFCPMAEEVLANIDDWSQITFGGYRQTTMKRIFDDKLLFLGDAAHSMSPHLGQGLNLALLDAYVFAEQLAKTEDWLAACSNYQMMLKHHLRYYRFITGLLTPFFQSRGNWRGHFRNATLPWLHRLPWIRTQMALTMTGMKSGFIGVKVRWFDV